MNGMNAPLQETITFVPDVRRQEKVPELIEEGYRTRYMRVARPSKRPPLERTRTATQGVT